ncbi:hypothetical protein ACEQPO_03315 [Bacillus sp. SL00103]
MNVQNAPQQALTRSQAEELTAGQRVAAGGMATTGYIPIVGWAGRIFKGGKAVYKTTQATSAAVRAVDIYKTSQNPLTP